MANFYTLEEAAKQLGISPQEVQRLADNGELQPFRDGSRVMFKAEQVDALAQNAGSSGDSAIPLADDTDEIGLADDTQLGQTPLSDETSTDEISLADDTATGELSLADDTATGDGLSLADDTQAGSGELKLADTAQGTSMGLDLGDTNTDLDDLPLQTDSGATDTIDLNPTDEPAEQGDSVNVFDDDDVEEEADPMAQTLVTSAKDDDIRDDDLSMDSIGSGSGLLDLTRESDDTSLGAELLDEIYPGAGGEGSDAKLETTIGSSGIFDGTITESGATATGMEVPSQEGDGPGDAAMPAMGGAGYGGAEVYDAAGSTMGLGMLLGASAALVVAFILVLSALVGVPHSITTAMAESTGTLMTYTGIGLLLCVVLGLGGYLIGKNLDK